MLTFYQRKQWTKLKNLMLLMFGAWLTVFFTTNTFSKWLNKFVVPLLNLPLGSYIPAQAAIIVFAVMLFWFARATGYARQG